MSLFDDLPHRVSVYEPSVTKDSSGGEVITWPTLRAAGVPCLICAGQGGERDEFDQSQRPVSTHTIAFSDYTGGARPGDQFIDDNTGQVYRYTGGRPQQAVGGIDEWNVITVREVE